MTYDMMTDGQMHELLLTGEARTVEVVLTQIVELHGTRWRHRGGVWLRDRETVATDDPAYPVDARWRARPSVIRREALGGHAMPADDADPLAGTAESSPVRQFAEASPPSPAVEMPQLLEQLLDAPGGTRSRRRGRRGRLAAVAGVGVLVLAGGGITVATRQLDVSPLLTGGMRVGSPTPAGPPPIARPTHSPTHSPTPKPTPKPVPRPATKPAAGPTGTPTPTSPPLRSPSPSTRRRASFGDVLTPHSGAGPRGARP